MAKRSLSESRKIAIIYQLHTATRLPPRPPKLAWAADNPGQVAQLVERSPEKAGVGGSIPSLATMFSVVYRARFPQFQSISFQNSGLSESASE